MSYQIYGGKKLRSNAGKTMIIVLLLAYHPALGYARTSSNWVGNRYTTKLSIWMYQFTFNCLRGNLTSMLPFHHSSCDDDLATWLNLQCHTVLCSSSPTQKALQIVCT
ncbi:hypothetical protein BDV29DRAFT_172257 [Aspergillus leporis]|uniref:Uncharacterized protein n=1 Tax=Aspergillus leporis TaxID=41062 RepID=A0A5N5X7N8_9EURO|nr:hypothetical protein BDV29DRAFT_172257 [Aspergillus leporis]